MWHLHEMVSQVKKSHCHAYEPGPTCFKILLYQFRLVQEPRSAVHLYGSSPGLRNLDEDITTPYCTTFDHEGMTLTLCFNRGASGLAVSGKRLNSGAEQAETSKG